MTARDRTEITVRTGQTITVHGTAKEITAALTSSGGAALAQFTTTDGDTATINLSAVTLIRDARAKKATGTFGFGRVLDS